MVCVKSSLRVLQLLRPSGNTSFGLVVEMLTHSIFDIQLIKSEQVRVASISLWDIQFLPTRSKFTFFPVFSTLSPMHQNVVTLGGVCVCFSKSVRKGHFRNVWVGGGGVGGHSFAHRAVQGRTHRAQAMVQGSLIIPNPIRRHRCPFPQGPGLHWGTDPRACDWEHISSVFPNPAACVASLVPTLCSGAWPTGRQL